MTDVPAAAKDADPPRALVVHKAAVPPANNGLCDMLRLMLPAEILRKIVSYGDIRSNVRLAACSMHYRNFVFKDCPSAWEDIAFEEVTNAKNLSDANLHTLLTNCNAVKVTRSLSLMGCTTVSGQGLAALSYSRRLEQIDLRRSREEMEDSGDTGLENGFVISVLKTMPPINTDIIADADGVATTAGGLKLVKFRRQHDDSNFYDSFDDQISGFYSELTGAIAEHLKNQRTPCGRCKIALVDAIAQEDFHRIAPFNYCSSCNSFTCCKCSNPTQCFICLDQFCDLCETMTFCKGCLKRYCSYCKVSYHCRACEGTFCDECRVTMYCCGCYSIFCDECTEVLHCNSCDEWFCTECETVKGCDVCDKFFCSECVPVVDCQKCNFSSCGGCNKVKIARGNNCVGTCSKCDIVCSCKDCKMEMAKQQVSTKCVSSLEERSDCATKRPRLS